MISLILNDQGLPYPDPLHPIVVHFIIAMVFFSLVCDIIGYFTHHSRLFEVGFWNLFIATIAIFVAILLGQFEAGLANTYDAVKPTLNLHTIIGWSLSILLIGITAWRFTLRRRDPLKIPPAYLGLSTLLSCFVFLQTYLGTKLVWLYGLHVEPVVQAAKQGVLQ